LCTIQQTKLALSPFDDKRFLDPNNPYNTLPLVHKKIPYWLDIEMEKNRARDEALLQGYQIGRFIAILAIFFSPLRLIISSCDWTNPGRFFLLGAVFWAIFEIYLVYKKGRSRSLSDVKEPLKIVFFDFENINGKEVLPGCASW